MRFKPEDLSKPIAELFAIQDKDCGGYLSRNHLHMIRPKTGHLTVHELRAAVLAKIKDIRANKVAYGAPGHEDWCDRVKKCQGFGVNQIEYAYKKLTETGASDPEYGIKEYWYLCSEILAL